MRANGRAPHLRHADTLKMFTGIITAIGEIRTVTHAPGQDMRAIISAPPAFLAAHGGTAIGASIACSGCCLTATELGADWFAVDVSSESVARTTLGTWRHGTRINLERSLRLGDELGGHMVSGHVDGLGHIVSVTPDAGSLRIAIAVPPPLHRFIAPKGSVAVDGISLTVNEVLHSQAGAEIFGVNIIPHTADHTTLGLRAPGDAVHIEIDMLARYVARLAETA
jgi:riboflavin synthase